MSEGKHGYVQSIIVAISLLPSHFLFILHNSFATYYLIMFSIGHLLIRGWDTLTLQFYFRTYHIAIYYLHLIRPHHCLLEHDNFLISLFLASLSLGASNMVIRLVKVIHPGRLTDLAPDFIIWIIQVQISRNYLRYAGNAKMVSGIDTENEVQSKHTTQNKIFMTSLTTKAQKTHLTKKYNAWLLWFQYSKTSFHSAEGISIQIVCL